MLVVGLTGGIGGGKSTVANLFAALGIPIYNSDSRSKNLIDNNAQLKNSIMKTFDLSLDSDGMINKKALAAIVFNDSNQLEKLNKLVHPQVAIDFQDWISSHSKRADYVIKEAAILFESGGAEAMDQIITVTAPQETRIKRVIARDGVTREDVLKRMDNQWSEDRKVELSDFTINNGGEISLIKQVLEIDRLLKLKKSNSEEE